MAFVANNLSLVFIGGGGFAKRWSYITTDSLPTVQASGYFDSTVANRFDIGDIIDVTVVDAVAVGSRTSVTGSVALMVATNDDTTVTTTQMLPANAVVAVTAATLSATAALHAGRIVTLAATPIVVTLPAATGTGNKYTFVVTVAATATETSINAAGTDVMAGNCYVTTTTSTNAEAFATSATSDSIDMNGTTKGGIVGDRIELIDVASGVWNVVMNISATGTEATPFAAT